MKPLSTLLLATVFLSEMLPAAGPVPRMVRDINAAPNGSGSYPEALAALGNRFYFMATHYQSGRELWSSDGTAAGTQLVKDVKPGPDGGLFVNNFGFVPFGGRLYFSASDGEHGAELWHTDGTAAGTVMVKDVRQGAGNSVSDWPGHPVASGSRLFFAANDGTTGQELFMTDGTAAGTVLVKDIYPGPENSIGGYAPIVDMGGFVCFPAWDGVNGEELWRSDGTAAGTVMVKDILPGSDSGVSAEFESSFCVQDGILYFAARDGSTGGDTILWRSDGTAPGTWIVKPVPYSDAVLNPTAFTRYGGKVFFTGKMWNDGTELWRTDGTAGGTERVANINGTPAGAPAGATNASNPAAFMQAGTSLYFQANDGVTGNELWVLRSPTGLPSRVKDIRSGPVPWPNPPLSSNPFPMAAPGGQLLFHAEDGVNGRALWRTDGTEAGTALYSDPLPGPGSAFDTWSSSLIHNGIAFFQASDGIHGPELWRTDGTAAGTFMVRDINAGTGLSTPVQLTASGGTLYFTANDGVHGREIWKSDGTAAGTMMVKEIYPGTGADWEIRVVPFAGGAAFAGNFGTTPADQNLWATDGTAAGTRVLFQCPQYERPVALTGAGSRVFFLQRGAGIGTDLWSADAAGASRVIAIPQATTYDYSYASLVSTPAGALYLRGPEIGGWALWRSNGASWGTSKLKSFGANPVGDVYARGESLFFAGGTAGTGQELWQSDGTAGGTSLLTDVLPGSESSNCAGFAAAGGLLYFTARNPESGIELWKSDGTPAGAALVRDIYPGPGNSSVTSLTPAGGRVFFIANDGVAGKQVWISDGTVAGTHMVKYIGPDTQADYLVAAGLRVYFAARDAVHGWQIWTSDGSEGGTFMAGPVDYDIPRHLTVAGRRLYFSALQQPANKELWSLPVIAPPAGNLSLTSTSTSGALFTAAVDPGAQSTTAVVEYGSTTAYGQTITLSLAGDFYPETLTVPVTGLAPGTTWHARLTITNPSGTLTGGDVVFSTITADYAAWIQSHFGTSEASGVSAPGADADGDGQLNELEYLAGTDPLLFPSVFSFSFTNNHGGIMLSPVRPGIRYYLETASDLQSWTAQAPEMFASPDEWGTIELVDVQDREFVRVRLERVE